MKRKLIKITALGLAINMLASTIAPTVAYALTAGPSSPEFSSFEPVATTDMVNVFSGDFNYNLPVVEIPGPDGAGYALSLAYHGGSSSEDEASWVGYGFTLNPGSINRNTRGFPDDYDKTPIQKYNKTPLNWSAMGGKSIGLEFFAQKFGLSASTTVRYNNSQGLANHIGFGFNIKGVGSINASVGPQGTTYSAGIDVMSHIRKFIKPISREKSAIKDAFKKGLKNSIRNSIEKFNANGAVYGLFAPSEEVRSTAMSKHKTKSFDFSVGVTANFGPVPIGANIGLSGNLNVTRNEEKADYDASGYIHNRVNVSGGDVEMNGILSDYYIEKGSPYKKRDLFVGIPFNNADNFVAAGEGISGGFRYFTENAGHFYPDHQNIETFLPSLGLTAEIIGSWGFGMQFGVGLNKSIVKDWGERGSSTSYQFNGNGMFRFANDMGGSVSYGDSKVITTAKISVLDGPGNISGINLKGKYAVLSGQTKPTSSSYIGVHTAEDVLIGGKKYNKRPGSLDWTRNVTGSVTNGVASNLKSIVELAVTNTDGMNYVYGQPVFTRNDVNMQFDVKYDDYTNRDFNYIAYTTTPVGITSASKIINTDIHKTAVGEVRKVPYTSAYLLTQITTPDFVDITDDGPTNDDFGGWTNMHYFKKYGAKPSIGSGSGSVGSENWYRWRTPYNGLMYNKGQISNTKDDVGSVSCGEKEVHYLKAIETKTHIAFFVTNESDPTRFGFLGAGVPAHYLTGTKTPSGAFIPRQDGRDAAALTSSGDPASTKQYLKGTNKLEYLEKVVLFSKTRLTKPLKTTCFKYHTGDKTLVQNLPNHVNGNFSNKTSNNSGKLTLHKVWFEYEDVVTSKISPYEFVYEYKDMDDIPAAVKERYPKLFGVGGDYVQNKYKYSATDQNPDYNPHLLDGWGNIGQYAKERQKYMMHGSYQGNMASEPNPYTAGDLGWRGEVTLNTFVGTESKPRPVDPAAWQLKQIRLPSGGEILIEYEQKDYAFVQDKSPMTMASLITATENSGGDLPVYEINGKDLGLELSKRADYDETVALMNKVFQKKDPSIAADAEDINDNKIYYGKKIYFKFLYNLKPNDPTMPSLNECKSEYITGYSGIKEIKVVVVPPPTPSDLETYKIAIILTGESPGDRLGVPRQACHDFYVTQRNGKFDNDDCTCTISKTYDPIAEIFDAASTASKIASFTVIVAKMQSLAPVMVGRSAVGQKINLPLSYLRLPMIKAKKGGGVRVKRLMTYDPGINNETGGDAVLYGQEYTYEDIGKDASGNPKVISSGVATNEPSEQREESPLVDFIPPGSKQGWYSRITVGEDKEQTEGPIGESLLPGASIGHSRVIVQNIHKGAASTGFTVNEYYTVKDYAYDRIYATGDQLDYERGAKGVDYTNIDDNLERTKLNIPAGLFNFEIDRAHMSQGFRFIINNMHGQMRHTGSYVGDYKTPTSINLASKSFNDLLNYKVVSEQTQVYYEPGEMVKMLNPDGSWKWDLPGKEMDMAMEMKAVLDKTLDIKLDIAVEIGAMVPPPVYFAFSLAFSYIDKGINTHLTSKVIKYPVILKKTIAMQDGVRAVTENLAFNATTGAAMLTKTYDGFDGTGTGTSGSTHDGAMYALNIPATWYYPQMGAKNSDASLNTNQLSASAGSITSYGAGGNPLRDMESQLPGRKTWFTNNGDDRIKNVLSASAQTFKSNWFTLGDEISNKYTLTPTMITKLNNIWRPRAGFVYRDDVISSNATANVDGIKKGGIMKSPFEFFKYNPLLASDPKWILGSEVQKYTPYGNAVEEKNVLDVFSSASFGYGEKMPTLMANNAAYGSTVFKDYEYAPAYTNNVGVGTITTDFTHSGGASLKLVDVPNGKYPLLSANEEILVTKLTDIKGQPGAIVRFWAKSAPEDMKIQVIIPSFPIADITLEKVATVGDWAMYKGVVTAANLPPNPSTTDKINIQLVGINNTPASPMYLDDVKIQPKESQTTCYVYDTATLRLITQFDDQHFGMFYQYNSEGKLIRKQVETEKGLKTIQETQYNSKRKPRD